MSRFIQDFASLRSLGPMAAGFARAGSQWALNAAGTALQEYTSGVPAFDGPRGWLAEESRTNTALYSRDVNIAAWVHNGVDVVGGQADPFGGTSAVRLTENTDTFGSRRVYQWQAVGQAGAAYTSTFYAKYVDCPWVFVRDNISGATLRAWFNIQTGTVGTVNGGLTATITPVVDGWYRLSITSTADGTAQALSLFGMASADGVADHTEIGRSVLVAGAQHEKGAFATSPIHTEGATATRQPPTLTSSLSALGVDEVVNGIAGAISLYRKTPWDVPQGYGRFISLSSADGNERLDIHPSNGDSTIFATKYSGGSSVESIGSSTFDHRVNIDDAQLIVFRHTSSGFKMWITSDEQTVHEETTAAWQADWASSLVDLYAGSRNGGNNRVKAELFRSIQLWTGDDIPSDVELAALTADDLKMVPLDFSGATASEVLVEAPDVTRFRVGGDLNHVRWGVERTLVVGDGATRRYVPITLTAPVPTRFGAIVTPDATYHPGDAEAGDESYPLWLIGEGPHNPANGATSANVFEGGVASFLPMAYDLSAGAWIEGTAVPFAEPSTGVTGASTANKRQCNAIAAQGRRARVLELRRFRTPNTRPRLPGRRIRRSR